MEGFLDDAWSKEKPDKKEAEGGSATAVKKNIISIRRTKAEASTPGLNRIYLTWKIFFLRAILLLVWWGRYRVAKQIKRWMKSLKYIN